MFTKRVFETLKIGNPMNPDTNIGPLAIPEMPEILKEYCDDALSMGGQILIGGNMNLDVHGMGRFFEPTVIANANNGMKAVSEQIFGPIVCVQEVEDDRQAKYLINSSKYGLQASIFTSNPLSFEYFTSSLRVGVVNFNECPVFGDH